MAAEIRTSQTTGKTIDYPYYKDATIPSADGDIIEMSDPMFAIHYALSILHENDGQGDRATLALAKASSKLSGMRWKNVMPAWFQDNYAEAKSFLRGSSGFGE